MAYNAPLRRKEREKRENKGFVSEGKGEETG